MQESNTENFDLDFATTAITLAGKDIVADCINHSLRDTQKSKNHSCEIAFSTQSDCDPYVVPALWAEE